MERRVPESTYRLQLRPHGGLREAADTAGYLRRLGAGAVYTAPLLAAAPGSAHGYDGVDPTRACPGLGGEPARKEFTERLRAHGLGLVADIVPNHLSVALPEANPWWWEVLRDGPGSRFAHVFDIDWSLGPIRLPVLADDGDGGAAALDRLTSDAGALVLDGRRFPLAKGTGAGTDPRAQHRQQYYRLVSWRSAAHTVSYRRFFDINDLAALRMEDPRVFDAVHAAVLAWADRGEVDGLRIDHVDGLADPGGYLRRLRSRFPGWIVVEKILEPGREADLPPSWPVDGTTGYDALREVCGLFIDPAAAAPLTELAAGCGAATDPGASAARGRREAVAGLLGGDVRRIAALAASLGLAAAGRAPENTSAAGPEGVAGAPSGEPGAAGRSAADGGAGAAGTQPEPPAELRSAVAALLASFPVYRSYLPEGADAWEQAVAGAEKLLAGGPVPDPGGSPGGLRAGAGDAAAGEGRHLPSTDAEAAAAGAALERIDAAVRADPGGELAARLQQTSGAAAAKGVEDTAYYRATRFAALNEVGGDPGRFGVSPAEFHAAALWRAGHRPAAMTALSTHDTKRSEDVRARLAAVAEHAGAFAASVRRWRERCSLGEPALDLLAWQTLIGAWPISADRLAAYLLKAAREAGLRTSWTAPDPDFEEAVLSWPGRVFADPELAAGAEAFAERTTAPGWSNSLGQKLVQLAMPGVPDVYQGTELWDYSLVDPDNRRQVDFAARASILEQLEDGGRPPVDASGAAKMHVVRQALRLRRAVPLTGYAPLTADGPAADHAVAFARSDAGGTPAAVAVATRLPVGLEDAGGWRSTTLRLPDGPWTDLLTGRPASGTAHLGGLLSDYPVALLTRPESATALLA
ncbi:hypothetical protein GCM10027440_21640 [Nocardiopsis coralliicola]